MAFATHADVATRLGRSLSSAEQSTATQVIALVTGLIVDEVDRDTDWADDLSPVPEALKALCIEKARMVIENPTGAAVISETLGAHSVSRTAPRAEDAGIFITELEGRLVRQAVYGATAGSSQPRSVVDRVIDLAEGRDVDEAEEES